MGKTTIFESNNMKTTSQYFLIALCILVNIHHSIAQNTSIRIQEIKKMYAEAIDLEKQGSIKCKSEKKTAYDKPYTEPFEHTVKKCEYNNGYTILKGNFPLHESGETYVYYFKNNQLFFVLCTNGAECCNQEDRLYFDAKGNIIKILERNNNCDCNAELGSNTDVTDKTYKKEIKDKAMSRLKEIRTMLK